MTEDKLDDLADQLVAEAAGMAAGGAGNGGGAKKTEELSGHKDRNLNLILDIPLKVTVELGRTKMPVSELLNLTQGSVIEIGRAHV